MITVSRAVPATIASLAFFVFATAASAEGIASESKSLGSLTDDQCVAKAAKVLQQERSHSNFKRSIEGDYTVLTRLDYFGEDTTEYVGHGEAAAH